MKVSKRNYFLLVAIFALTLIFVLFINNVITNLNYVKKGTSVLESYISKISINEVSMALTESNEVILYVGYNYDKDIRKLEKEILKKIRIYNLEDYIYYCDVTDRLDDDKYVGDFISIFPNINGKLKKAPSLMYFKNNEIIEVIDSSGGIINANDLVYLIEKYGLGR